MDWPEYADGIGVDVIRGLYEAARDSLLGGHHPGPCTNDDDPGEACALHVAMSEARHKRLQEACDDLAEDVDWPHGRP